MGAVDTITFIKELSKKFVEIGAVLPSSPMLAKAMARPMEKMTGPRRILEVGPGTGPMTRQILRLMRPDDSFLVCEINPELIEHLKSRLQRFGPYQLHRDRVKFFCGPVQALGQHADTVKFDFICSSLPFNNFTPDTVEEILDLYESLLEENGALTYVEYIAVRKIAALVRNKSERGRVKAVEEVLKKRIDRYQSDGQLEKELTFFNVPPARTIAVNNR